MEITNSNLSPPSCMYMKKKKKKKINIDATANPSLEQKISLNKVEQSCHNWSDNIQSLIPYKDDVNKSTS
jgi:hypothetical protein